MKKAFSWIGITVLSFAVLIGIGFASGEIQAFYNRTTGTHVESSKTDEFHATKGYVDGMTQDLSRAKLELAQTKDSSTRQAILDHINEEFANFDENQIQNTNLRQFLIDVRNGGIR